MIFDVSILTLQTIVTIILIAQSYIVKSKKTRVYEKYSQLLFGNYY